MIKLKEACRHFQQGSQTFSVLKSINLEVKTGEFVAIIGQSGSGKSTLMNIMGCLDMLSTGSCTVDDIETSQMTPDELSALRREKFGFIFQRYNLLGSLSALENVMLPAIYAGLDEKVRINRATKLLTDLGLGDKIHHKPNELSGGQQQRVSIARALMNGGQIILADEPTGALDSASGEQVMDILQNLHQQGHTIILVTHDAKVASYAQRMIEIKDGEILRDTVNRPIEHQNTHQTQKNKKQSRLSQWKSQITEAFKMSLQAIKAHRMRSFLTMLGIVIGITSVVSISGIGEGTKNNIINIFNSIGTNYIAVKNKDYISTKGLTTEDAHIIKNLDFVSNTTPGISKSGILKYKGKALHQNLTGIDNNNIMILLAEELSQGRFFTQNELENATESVIINQHLANELFPNENPLGKLIRFDQLSLKVIGITKPMENAQKRIENLAWTPNTTVVQKMLGTQNNRLYSIVIYIKPNISMRLAEIAIKRYLTTQHGTQDFEIISSDSILKTVEKTTGILTLMVSSVAFISLLVGGIGVMNIMLVSVSERTREIGIRMAIGARQSNIKQQFIIEAILLCMIGGIISLILSYLISVIFNQYVSLIQMTLSIRTMMIALFASSSIGLMFGYFPAKNAAKLNPIEALSNE